LQLASKVRRDFPAYHEASWWWSGIMAFAIGTVAELVLVHLCGWPILAIGLASIAAGYFYTAWPAALGYMALGELTVFIFMGPVIVLGAYYVAALRFAWQPLVASLPIGFLVAAILHANNLRDIDMDVLNHKLTLANLFGRRAAYLEMVLLYAGAYAATVVAIVIGALPWLALATVVTIGAAWENLRTIVNETAPAQLDRAVLGSAKLQLGAARVHFAWPTPWLVARNYWRLALPLALPKASNDLSVVLTQPALPAFDSEVITRVPEARLWGIIHRNHLASGPSVRWSWPLKLYSPTP
jgi:hypothetical protein